MARNLMTKANMNDYLVNCIGIDEEEVALMPHYVKEEIVKDDYDLFLEYITDGESEENEEE